MNPKILIIIAVVGILGLVGFNMMLSHKETVAENRAESVTATTPPVATTPATTPTTNTPLGLQPKATMDKATSQINQANTETNAKMAQADNADGAK